MDFLLLPWDFMEERQRTKPEKSLAELKKLEDEIKKHPAHARGWKDEKAWKKIVDFGLGIGIVGCIIFGVCALVPPFSATIILLSEVMIHIIAFSIMLGSVAVCCGLYAVFLWARDTFNAEIKAENKQYAHLKKTIAELKILDEQQRKLDDNLAQTTNGLTSRQGENEVRSRGARDFEFSESENEKPYVYKLFQTTTAPANQTIVGNHQLSNTTKS